MAVEAALARQTTKTSTARQSNTPQTPLNNRFTSDAIMYANPDGEVRTSLYPNFFQPVGVSAEYMHRVMNEAMNHQTMGKVTNQTMGGWQATFDQLNQIMMFMVNAQNILQTLI